MIEPVRCTWRRHPLESREETAAFFALLRATAFPRDGLSRQYTSPSGDVGAVTLRLASAAVFPTTTVGVERPSCSVQYLHDDGIKPMPAMGHYQTQRLIHTM